MSKQPSKASIAANRILMTEHNNEKIISGRDFLLPKGGSNICWEISLGKKRGQIELLIDYVEIVIEGTSPGADNIAKIYIDFYEKNKTQEIFNLIDVIQEQFKSLKTALVQASVVG